MMCYTYALEERVQSLILSPPICLDSYNFAIELSFNKILKIVKALKTFIFMAQKVNPSKFAVVIDETDIIIVTPNRG